MNLLFNFKTFQQYLIGHVCPFALIWVFSTLQHSITLAKQHDLVQSIINLNESRIQFQDIPTISKKLSVLKNKHLVYKHVFKISCQTGWRTVRIRLESDLGVDGPSSHENEDLAETWWFLTITVHHYKGRDFSDVKDFQAASGAQSFNCHRNA